MNSIIQDVRYACRVLLKSRGFTVVALLTLMIGVSANTAIFSFVNAWVLQPLPYGDPDRLFVVWTTDTPSGDINNTSGGEFNDWKMQSQVFEQLAAYRTPAFNITGTGEPERVQGAQVSANFFDLLQVRPSLGRTFAAEEDEPENSLVVVLSDGMWRNRFAGDPGIVGKSMMIDGRTHTIVGVMPASFHVPLMGRIVLWKPLGFDAAARQNHLANYLHVFGRLKREVTQRQAQSSLDALASQLERANPQASAGHGIRLVSMHDEIGRQTGNSAVVILFVIVTFVLFIACANVANLMLSRATGRRREMAIRLAIGAGRGRVMRQLLTETILLFTTAGVLGSMLTAFMLDWMISAIPFENRGYLPNYGQISVDTNVLLFTIGVSILTGILFGLAPALEGSRMDLNAALKETSGKSSGEMRGRRLRNFFVVAELALALTLVVGAGLTIKSLVQMLRIDFGFNPSNVMAVQIELPSPEYSERPRIVTFYQELLDRIHSLPGVQAAGASTAVPFVSGSGANYFVEGKPEPPAGQIPIAVLGVITPDYFDTINQPLVSGRGFNNADSSEGLPVALVNEQMARLNWPGQDALGKQIRIRREPAVKRTIIGIVRDTTIRNLSFVADAARTGSQIAAEPQIFVPFAQLPGGSMTVVLRSTLDPLKLTEMIRKEVWAVDKDQPISSARTIQQIAHDEFAPNNIITTYMAVFAGIALFLATIGIYGVIAYSVANRTQEIGIRIALGATRSDVLGLVLRQSSSLVAIGTIAGLAGAFALSKVLAASLYGVKGFDLSVFVPAALMMAAAAFLASYIPARRATRVDPTVALRHE